VLLGTLYPLLTEALGVRVSVGPPYFDPAAAIFALPMLLVMAAGPLLRWRRDRLERVGRPLLLAGLMALAVLVLAFALAGPGILPLLGLGLGVGLAFASLMPLRGRHMRRLPLATWGMVIAHFGIAVALIGMASDSAFSEEKLAALKVGDTAVVGPWQVTLQSVSPVAGPNWNALEGTMLASYAGGEPDTLTPQARSFWAPPQETTESALKTRWNGQLYAVLGKAADGERWQVRLWWKPFVTLIWLGGLLIALGGVLALLGRVKHDVKRRAVTRKGAARRAGQGV
jgi:cytochrome c-type biogenesis protein CcmF